MRLRAPAQAIPALDEFYGDRLEIEAVASRPEFLPGAGQPFYHFALLVPGDRFDAALEWLEDRVEPLPDRESGEIVFDFSNWNARAVYFHDPAGNIVELIAHRGVGEQGAEGAFSGAELLGFSELGLVGEPAVLAQKLAGLALEVWDGTVAGEGLAFVGEPARTLILSPVGRPWLPTGRPAEAHPLDVVLTGPPSGEVEAGGYGVRRA